MLYAHPSHLDGSDREGKAMQSPEAQARVVIDAMLQQVGWAVQDANQANLATGRGEAIREFPLKLGYGYADDLLFVDQQAVGVIEAKRAGTTLAGVEVQSQKYGEGLPDHLFVPIRPLPFRYESTGIEARCICGLDPESRRRRVFHVHRPVTLTAWIAPAPERTPGAPGSTLRDHLRQLPPLITRGLQPAQNPAVQDINHSLTGAPRILIPIVTGSEDLRATPSSPVASERRCS